VRCKWRSRAIHERVFYYGHIRRLCDDLSVSQLTARLARRLYADFGVGPTGEAIALTVGAISETEKIQAATILWMDGKGTQVGDAIRLAKYDPDLLLGAAGLESQDWPSRLSELFGNDTSGD
jgi:hypothetical protein